MATDKMIAERDGSIGRMIFNNPERRNAVSLEMWEAMVEIVAGFVADDAVRVIVVEGAGDKAFVSGADVSRFEEERSSPEAVARYGAAVSAANDALLGASKPTIAKIQGFCVGGGVGIAVGCDLRICSDDSQFAIPAARLGLGYGPDGMRKLVELVGPAATKEIFFTARRFSADEALAMGLVNQVVPRAGLDAYVADYADRIGANAPLTVRQVKATVGELMKDAADRDLAMCDEMVQTCFESMDFIEGRNAFNEKRRPEFKGR